MAEFILIRQAIIDKQNSDYFNNLLHQKQIILYKDNQHKLFSFFIDTRNFICYYYNNGSLNTINKNDDSGRIHYIGPSRSSSYNYKIKSLINDRIYKFVFNSNNNVVMVYYYLVEIKNNKYYQGKIKTYLGNYYYKLLDN
jgi:hypothetical protein